MVGLADPQPDLIVQFSLGSTLATRKEGSSAVVEEYSALLLAVKEAGYSAIGRPGAVPSEEILVFVKAQEGLVAELADKERAEDWLYRVGSTNPLPTQERDVANDPIYPADRIRLLHSHLVSALPPSVFPHVRSIFPPHSPSFIHEWSSQWTWTTFKIPQSSLTQLAHTLGPQIALYFAFVQTYFQFLTFPAALGALFWLADLPFHPIYAVGLTSWSIVFIESWRLQERELSVLWGTYDAHKVEPKRRGFGTTKELQTLGRACASVPVIVLFAAILVALISCIYSVETLVNDAYDGAGKAVLALLPTVLFAGVVPQLTGYWHTTATRLTEWEDHKTESRYAASLAIKVFSLQFFVAFGSLLLTSFVYIPFASRLVPIILTSLSATSRFVKPTASFHINALKLKTQLVAYTLTGQAVGAFTEIGLPFVLKQAKEKMSKQTKVPPKKGQEDEAEWLERMREEVARPEFESFNELSEMATQFGYCVLFSTIWPIAPLWSLINNFFELRGDAFKLAKQSRRPVPTRSASIGPWLEILSFLSWFGTLTHTALIYLYRPTPSSGASTAMHPALSSRSPREVFSLLFTALLLSLASEHAYILFRLGVRFVLRKAVWDESWAKKQLERRERAGREVVLAQAEGGRQQLIERRAMERKALEMTGQTTVQGEFWQRPDEGAEWVQRKNKDD